jgi:hypothetical protein
MESPNCFSTWRIEELVRSWPLGYGEIPPVREPELRPIVDATLGDRVLFAWMVFTGKADILVW